MLGRFIFYSAACRCLYDSFIENGVPVSQTQDYRTLCKMWNGAREGGEEDYMFRCVRRQSGATGWGVNREDVGVAMGWPFGVATLTYGCEATTGIIRATCRRILILLEWATLVFINRNFL